MFGMLCDELGIVQRVNPDCSGRLRPGIDLNNEDEMEILFKVNMDGTQKGWFDLTAVA